MRKKKREPETTADDRTWALISNKMSEIQVTNLENEELAGMINLLTGKLSAKQKTIFVLSEIEELSNDEISMVTGMTKLNIKANLHYAKKRLNEMIKKHL